ncbi:hypothetical protein NDU88_008809 [Pleurodeles waltl]|uniref:Uncharacterized protein n=1 Tax=Pleurodeles waltl TaxID=8319 RepID=A0AAV7QTL0_PLEWA|nr:hypothetical protein NDU88_008809 [Pleurodeles waltl]
MQGDTFFSLSDHSSWSSNEQLDLEADKTSSEFDSEVSTLALGRESHESSKNATVRKKQKKRSEQPNPVSLETIYQSIMEHREESKSESRKTQLACRKMQIQIRRVAKTCSEFATRMEEVETRISHLEDEAGSHQKYDRSGMMEIPIVEAVKSGAKIGKLYTLLKFKDGGRPKEVSSLVFERKLEIPLMMQTLVLEDGALQLYSSACLFFLTEKTSVVRNTYGHVLVERLMYTGVDS